MMGLIHSLIGILGGFLIASLLLFVVILLLKIFFEKRAYLFPVSSQGQITLRLPPSHHFRDGLCEFIFRFGKEERGRMRFKWDFFHRIVFMMRGQDPEIFAVFYQNEGRLQLYMIHLKGQTQGKRDQSGDFDSPVVFSQFDFRLGNKDDLDYLRDQMRTLAPGGWQAGHIPLFDAGLYKFQLLRATFLSRMDKVELEKAPADSETPVYKIYGE